MTARDDGIKGQLAEVKRGLRPMRTLNACIFIGLLLCGGAVWLGRSLNLPALVAVGSEIGIFPMVFALPVFAVTLVLLVRSDKALPVLKRFPLTFGLTLVNFVGALVFFLAAF